MADQNRKNYAHGSIIRIKLENFVTYDSLEFSPGANLNVIIGPNGTGKSTIVCAICLGMAGKPSILGRAGNICDYIKYGKNRASIEIELSNTKGRNYVIRRDLFKDNRSEWFLNGKQAKVKEIEELVMELNIQVSNLCQFLPQEKVTEFARMNPQQLLENTEKAVGGVELYEKHLNLKEQREESKNYERDLINIKESLKKEEAINARLENQVKSFLEKRKYEESILLLKKKRAWMQYNEKKKDFETIKKEKDDISDKVKELDEEYEPLEDKRKEIEAKLNKQKNALNTKSTAAKDIMKSFDTHNTKREELNDKIVDIKNDYQNKEADYKQRKSKIEELKLNIDALKTEYDESKADLADIKRRDSEIRDEEQKLRQQKEAIFNKEHDTRSNILKLKGEREELKSKIVNLQNVRSEKLRKLRQNYNNAYEAIEWLSLNRDKFQGEVYEPMILLINMKNQDAAKYVESLIPRKDLNALFLFENSNDMHYFITELRDKRQLVVHAAMVPKEPVDRYEPPYRINDIKKFGFRSYIREVIDAPDAVLRYLCMYSQIYRVPYGDDYTQKNISQILPQIPELSRIYTSTHQYSYNKSRYSNKVTSSSFEVPNAYFLSSSVNTSDLNETVEREKQLKIEIDELEAQSTRIGDEHRKIDKCLEQLKSEQNKLREREYHISSLDKKIKAKIQMLEKYESQKLDMITEAQKKFKSLAEYTKKRISIYNNCNDLSKNLLSLNREKLIIAYKLVLLQRDLRKNEAASHSYTAKKQELQRLLENHSNLLKQYKEEARLSLQNACKLCGFQSEQEFPKELKQKFSQLPNTLEEIESLIHETEAKSQCSYDVDRQVVDDFNERKKKIEQLQKDCEKKEAKLNNHRNNYEKIKNEWNDEIETMIKVISEKFSNLFRMLKCTGEVGLSRPDNPEDYAHYGISIRVSFRSEEKLQELTAWQQSGGEKSVSTMLYMIALQEMTRCPFRVVDEINQGMDPVNERKVFDIIVKNSSLKTSAQYFLLTPKLLPDLAFDEKTKVICVFNGPHNMQHSKFNLNDFIERRKKMNVNG